MITVEEWKVIKDFPRYQVSNLGNIKSCIGSETILKPNSDGRGYMCVKLCGGRNEDGVLIVSNKKVHRLVAEYFCQGFDEKKEVHHKNLQREDNKAENLLVLTRKEHLELHRKIREQQKEEGSITEDGNADSSKLEDNTSK